MCCSEWYMATATWTEGEDHQNSRGEAQWNEEREEEGGSSQTGMITSSSFVAFYNGIRNMYSYTIDC